MQILSSEEMKEAEKKAIESYISSLLLMESAAEKVVKIAEREIEDIENKRVVVVCGDGNNGGDGFAVARKLFNLSKKVDVLFCGNSAKLSSDGAINFEIAKNMGIKFIEEPDFKEYDIVIDAIFGTGVSRTIEGKVKEIIEKINSAEKFVIAVDIPSGIICDTGEVAGTAVKADVTVTFHRAKPAHYLYPGREMSGTIYVEDIGIKEEFSLNGYKREVILKQDILIKNRKKELNKMSGGRVMVIAGKSGYSGAAYLCSQAAVRSGAGIVYLVIPDSISGIIESKSTETVKIAVKSTKSGGIAAENSEKIIELIKKLKIDSIVIGPGLGREEDIEKIVADVLMQTETAVIADADALYFIKEGSVLLQRESLIITPHEGEFERVTGRAVGSRITAAESFAKENGAVLILKGADTIIAGKGFTYINSSGNPGMAKAGMGDVLAGLLGGVVARGYGIEESCKTAVYIHGYAADIAALEKSEESLIPEDVIEYLGKAFLGLGREQ